MRPIDARSSTTRRTTTIASVVALVCSLSFAALVVPPPATTLAAGTELVRNPDFVDGTNGWRTNRATQQLAAVTITGGSAARLTTTKAGTAVLNDAVNTVADTGAPGATYRVEARVRTTTPGVKGALRVREVGASRTRSHQSGFALGDTNWTTVVLDVTTTEANALLDLNVVAWKLQPGMTLLVDRVSMTRAAGPPPTTTAPPTTRPPTTAPPTTRPQPDDSCEGPVPAGTSFGASLSTVGQTTQQSLNQIDSAFGRNDALRIFHSGLPASWSSSKWALLKDRLLVISFRPSPQSVLAGQHDAFFRKWFQEAPADQPIFWSYIHEPESEINDGDFTVSQYKAAWRRIDSLAEQACKPNMHATLILTGWTAMPASHRDYRLYDAGPDVIDVIAWDPYNGAPDKDRAYYDSIENFLVPAGEVMKRDGRPWGIAETGSRLVPGDPGAGRAQWLRDVGNYAIGQGATFVTYFQSTNGGDYRLTDAASKAVWRAFVAR